MKLQKNIVSFYVMYFYLQTTVTFLFLIHKISAI